MSIYSLVLVDTKSSTICSSLVIFLSINAKYIPSPTQIINAIPSTTKREFAVKNASIDLIPN